MKKISIELDEKQYLHLISNYIMAENILAYSKPDLLAKYKDFDKYLLSHANGLNIREYLYYNSQHQMYLPTQKLAVEIQEYISKFCEFIMEENLHSMLTTLGLMDIAMERAKIFFSSEKGDKNKAGQDFLQIFRSN
jgi:hypothetical protein